MKLTRNCFARIGLISSALAVAIVFSANAQTRQQDPDPADQPPTGDGTAEQAAAQALGVLIGAARTRSQDKDQSRDDADGLYGQPVAANPDWAAVNTSQLNGEIFSRADLVQQALSAGRQQIGSPVKLDDWIEQTETIEVPVLLPVSLAARGNAVLTHAANRYTFQAIDNDGDHIVVASMCGGYRIAPDHPVAQRLKKKRSTAPVLPRLNTKYRITRDERGQVLSFSKFNCSYEVSVVCTRDCTSVAKSKLVDVAESLGVINSR